MEKREFWYKERRVLAERMIEKVEISSNGAEKDFLICKTTEGGTILIDEADIDKLIPCELQEGDRVMYVSHGRIIGTTLIREVKGCEAIPEGFPARLSTLKSIPSTIAPNGLIAAVDDVEIWLHYPIVCFWNNLEYRLPKEKEGKGDKKDSIPNTAEFRSETSSGDKSRICIRRYPLENQKSCYIVTTTVFTHNPAAYDGSYECIGRKKGGLWVIMSQSVFQYTTWLKILNVIQQLQNYIPKQGGDK